MTEPISHDDIEHAVRNATEVSGLGARPIIRKLDFSQFHPLDHPAFSRPCFGWYGGPVNHVRLWWTYQASDAIRCATLCKLGRHRMVEWQHRDEHDVWHDFSACGACGEDETEITLSNE